jgi:hypothetical protein
MGPRAARPLTNDRLFALLEEADSSVDKQRRRRAAARFSIWTETYRALIAARIDLRWDDKSSREQLARHISMSLNVGLDIARQVCVVWKHGARRTVEGASDEARSALGRLIAESRFDSTAPIWNQIAFLVGAVIVVPVLRRGALRWDTLLPQHYTVATDPEDRMGTPFAVGWGNQPDATDPRDKTNYTVLDAEAWRYYEIGNGPPRQTGEEEHGLGEFPGETLRFDVPGIGTEWYGLEKDRIYDVTLDVGVLSTAMSWVRKAQCHKLLVTVGNMQNVAKGQKPDPEQNIEMDVPQGPGGVSIQALDFDTDPANAMKQILFLKEQAVEAFGIPGSAVTFDFRSGSEGERLRVTQEGLTEIRDTQIPFSRSFEHGLWGKSVALARSFGHRLANELPTDEEMRVGYQVRYPKLGRVFNDPQVEMEWTDFEIAKGGLSRVEWMRLRNPAMDDSQVRALMTQFLEEETWWINELAKRNMATNPDGNIETLAQAAGRVGGLTRADNAAQRQETETPDGEQ